MHDPLARLPIKYKLPLTFLIVYLVAIVIGGVLISQFARKLLHEQVVARLAAEAELPSSAIQARRDLLRRRVEDFASDGLIRGQLERFIAAPDAALGDSLRKHLETNKLPLVASFIGAAIVDANEELVVSTGPELKSDSEASRKFLERDASVVGAFIEPRESFNEPSFTISTPIQSLSGGRHIGFLIMQIHARKFFAAVANASDKSKVLSSRRLVVSDQLGNELLLEDHEAIPALAPKVRFLTRSDAERVKRDLVFESKAREIGANGWTVRVDVDSDEAMAPLRSLESRYLGTALVIMTVAFIAIFAIVHFIVMPLNHLRSASEQIAAGESGIRVKIRSLDEIGVVGASFNAMAEAVEARTQELEKNRNELAAVVASMRDGLCLLSSEGEVLLSNAAATPLKNLLTGGKEAASKRTCGKRDCAQCLSVNGSGPNRCEVEIDGRIHEVHATDLPAGGAVGGRLLVSRDITERLEMSERQAFHERMAVVGELTAVVAHEINNPLASISMYAQMLSDELPRESEYHEHVEVIKRNTSACSRAIRDLLENVRGSASEVCEFDLRDIAEDAARFIEPLAKASGVSLKVERAEKEALILGDETKLRQVLTNLAMNAVQAIDGQGAVEFVVSVNNNEAFVDVNDNGPGIPDDILDQVFEPFFTTKSLGKGTGLGLPTARRTIEEHGGGLSIETSSANGTSFQIRLPLASKAEAFGNAAEAERTNS
ncbi:MAG: two-component system NtrC family sensor kinase [Planctomycetota bacterium]|jgi:two-component system NtrC family sensor kinase